MKIRRGPNPGDHFTLIPNLTVRDARLSLRARGLLALLLSFSEGWEVTVEAVMRQVPEGRDAVRAAMKELEHEGYAVRTKIQDARGRWRTVLEIGGTARSAAARTAGYPQGEDSADSKNCGKPGVGGPGVGKPGASKKTIKKTSSSNARARDDVPGGARVVGAAAAEMASPRTNDPDVSSSARPPDPVLPMAAPGLPSEASMSSSAAAEVREGSDLAELAELLSSQFGLGDWWPDGHKPVARFRVWLDAGWLIDDLVGMLLDRAATATKSRPGLIRTILDGHPSKPPQAAPPPRASRWCGECVDGWIPEPDGHRSNRLCPCRYSGADPEASATTTAELRTIPGGRHLASVPRTNGLTTRARVESA